MDPWLEQYWGDVHARLVNLACDQVNEHLPRELVARMQERVYIESPLLEKRAFAPDVHVYEPARRRRAAPERAGATSAATALAEPERLHLSAVEVTEPYIEIRDAKSGGAVVTTIEFVSASNKGTVAGRKKYLQKQREVLASETNLLEVDLLRAGRSVTLARPAVVPVERRAAYHACARRGYDPDILDYYALPLRERLPSIRVPLRTEDDDAPLNLQALVDAAYVRGRYAETIDYSRPPRPPLSPDDAQWANELIRRSMMAPNDLKPAEEA